MTNLDQLSTVRVDEGGSAMDGRGRRRPDLAAGEPPAEVLRTLVTLFLQTSVWLLVAQTVLSQNVAMGWAALRISAVLWLWTGVAGVVRSWTGSICLGLVTSSLGLLLAMFVPVGWMWTVVLPAPVFWVCRPTSGVAARLWRRPSLWLGSALSAALVLSVTHYGDFSIMDKVRQGVVQQDTLFHASISAMLKTYGVSSTGLDGLVPIAYHVWVHRMLAAFSTMAGVPVLETFGIATTVVLCPLLLFAVAWAAGAMGAARNEHEALRLWIVMSAVFIVLKLLPLEWWAGWDSYFVSESYALGLVYFVMALPGIVSRERTTAATLISGVLLVLAGLSKISLGVIGFAVAAVVTALTRPPAGRRASALAILGPALILIAPTATLARSLTAASANDWAPLGSLRVHAVWGSFAGAVVDAVGKGASPAMAIALKGAAAVVMFAVVTFVLSWIVVVRRWRATGAGSVLRNGDSVANLAAVAVGMGVLALGPPGDFYFLNPAMFVALPLLVAAGMKRSLDLSPIQQGWAIGTIALLSIWLITGESRGPLGGVYLKSRQSVLDAGDRGRVNDFDDALLAIRGRHVDRTAVLRPDATFPSAQSGIWNCAKLPFVYPAVTERAWIGVLKPDSPCAYHLYGYPDYFAPTPSRTLVAPVLPRGATEMSVSGSPVKRVDTGEWISPAYSPNLFSGSRGMQWMVEPKDVSTLAFTRIGHTMIVMFDLDSTSVELPLGVALQLAVPDGAVPARTTFAAVQVRDNGRDGIGMAQVLKGQPVIYFYNAGAATNWGASANLTRIAGQITFEVR